MCSRVCVCVCAFRGRSCFLTVFPSTFFLIHNSHIYHYYLNYSIFYSFSSFFYFFLFFVCGGGGLLYSVHFHSSRQWAWTTPMHKNSLDLEHEIKTRESIKRYFTPTNCVSFCPEFRKSSVCHLRNRHNRWPHREICTKISRLSKKKKATAIQKSYLHGREMKVPVQLCYPCRTLARIGPSHQSKKVHFLFAFCPFLLKKYPIWSLQIKRIWQGTIRKIVLWFSPACRC